MSNCRLVEVLAELCKHKNSKSLMCFDRKYMIVKPKVSGILYALSDGFCQGFNPYIWTWNNFSESVAVSARLNPKAEPDELTGMYYASEEELFYYNNDSIIGFLKAGKLYAIPIINMKYIDDSVVEVIVRVDYGGCY